MEEKKVEELESQEEMKNEEPTLEVEKKKKNKTGLIIVIAIIVVSLCMFAGYRIQIAYNAKIKSKEVKETKEIDDETEEDTEEETTESTPSPSPTKTSQYEPEIDNEIDTETRVAVTDEAIKNRFKKFIDICSSWEYIPYFKIGKVGLSQDFKIKLTVKGIYYNNYVTQNITIPNNIIERLKGIKPSESYDHKETEKVDSVTLSNFNSTYQELFNEKPTYDIETVFKSMACPLPRAYDEQTDTLYLFHRCGGYSPIQATPKILSVEETSKYYYVTVELTNTNIETKKVTGTENVVWKFDKEYRFKSTKKE